MPGSVRFQCLPPREQMPPLIRCLDQAFQEVDSPELTIPDFSGATQLNIFSDFSNRLGRWRTYGFLALSEEGTHVLLQRLKELRREFRIEDGRRLEYKAMRDTKRWGASQDWLEAFDGIEGVCFGLMVRDDVISAIATNHPSSLSELLTVVRELGLGDWSTTASGAETLEHAMRIVHCIAYLHAALCDGKATLKWICDNDEILDGPVRRPSIDRLLAATVEKYSGRPLPSSVTTEAELGADPIRDGLSLPDLLCAGILEYQRGSETNAQDMIAKAAVVCSWLKTVSSLQKVALRLTGHPEHGMWFELLRPYFSPLVHAPLGTS